ncbi:HsdM family class I SAM-dependent methyltransferase [Lamprocystis purpurea]|uniref:HsdM family class I SAM-dependent methyltransferase n=1 Tax=Lamprocystis purpurea TaxID=61598 RepID=UPI000364E6D1|nr:N-6 DNA methylase [Lamprocystis purpurea]
MFAESAGKKGGDFYTPRDVIRLMVRILKPTAGMRVYDPTCGSGGMLIISREFVEQSSGDSGNLFLAGQVNDASAWSICKLIWLPRSGVGARPDAPASRESSGRRSGQDGIPTRSVGTRREAQQRQPLALPGDDIPQRVPDLRQRAQVVMGIHQGLEARLLGRGDGFDDDFAEIHACALGQQGADALYTRAAGQCPESRTTAR